MTAAHDDPDHDDMREVRQAYQDLPPPSPDAALDARVRAAVAAELGKSAGGANTGSGQVIAFPRSPRALRGFALAATVLAAVGIGYSLQDRDAAPAPAKSDVARPVPQAGAPALSEAELRQRASVALSTPAPGSAPVPASAPAQAPPAVTASLHAVEESPRITSAPRAAAADAERSRAAARNRGSESVDIVASRASSELVLAPPPPPPPMAIVKREMLTPAPTVANPAADAVRQAAAVPASAPAGSPARLEAKLAKPAPPDPDAATFEAIRRLLSEQRVDEAREQMRRWHDEHRDHAVPSDLRRLLPDTPR